MFICEIAQRIQLFHFAYLFPFVHRLSSVTVIVRSKLNYLIFFCSEKCVSNFECKLMLSLLIAPNHGKINKTKTTQRTNPSRITPYHVNLMYKREKQNKFAHKVHTRRKSTLTAVPYSCI